VTTAFVAVHDTTTPVGTTRGVAHVGPRASPVNTSTEQARAKETFWSAAVVGALTPVETTGDPAELIVEAALVSTSL